MNDVLELVDRNSDLLGIGIKLIADMFCEQPGGEIRRSRLDTNLGNHDGARVFCDTIVFLDHLTHPDRLASHIKVVSACLGADLEDRFTILAVGADGRQQNLGLERKGLEAFLITNVGNLNGCVNGLVSSSAPMVDDNNR